MEVALSILIPTYNYVCVQLVKDLHAQCEALRHSSSSDFFSYEIIVADDASTDQAAVRANSEINAMSHCRYVLQERNVGRAVCRNNLIIWSSGKYLLIIDADAAVCSADFLSRYWAVRDAAKIVVGGICTSKEKPLQGHELRWRYEIAAEKIRSLAYRCKHPYQNFSTFNFLVNRDVCNDLLFDERCVDYGYEDTLFGIMLQRNGVPLMHIDNPLQHQGINSNVSFLKNTETSLRVLHSLGEPMQSYAGVSRACRLLSSVHADVLVRLLYRMFCSRLRKILLGRNPSLFLFKIYKVGYYLSLPHKAAE